MKWIGLAMLVLSTFCVGCYDYSVESDDVTCDENTGECIVCTNSDCTASLTITTPDPSPIRDVCEGDQTTNLLAGTCWWERCYKGEKSLFPKIAGTPCIMPGEGGSPWIEGRCDDSGRCGQ